MSRKVERKVRVADSPAGTLRSEVDGGGNGDSDSGNMVLAMVMVMVLIVVMMVMAPSLILLASRT